VPVWFLKKALNNKKQIRFLKSVRKHRQFFTINRLTVFLSTLSTERNQQAVGNLAAKSLVFLRLLEVPSTALSTG